MAATRPIDAADAAPKRDAKWDPNAPLENLRPGPDDSKPAWMEDAYHPKYGFEFRFYARLTAEDFLQRKNSRFWLIALKAESHLKQSILAVGRVPRPRVDVNFERGEVPEVGETGSPSAESLAWQTAKQGPLSTKPWEQTANQMVQGAQNVHTNS